MTEYPHVRAVLRSDLPALARLLMLAMSTLAPASGEIPAARTPSLIDLSAMTGMSLAAVKKHKGILVASGWLLYTRPTYVQMARHESGRYTLTVGPRAATQPPAEPVGGRLAAAAWVGFPAATEPPADPDTGGDTVTGWVGSQDATQPPADLTDSHWETAAPTGWRMDDTPTGWRGTTSPTGWRGGLASGSDAASQPPDQPRTEV
jgi:hypothetical protein